MLIPSRRSLSRAITVAPFHCDVSATFGAFISPAPRSSRCVVWMSKRKPGTARVPLDDDSLSRVRTGILSSVRKLRRIDLDILQIEIISHLMEGKRTATELVMEIYMIEPGQPDYQARYATVRRSLKDLEARGYASTNLLGRDKPYRLTRHGIAVICSIVPGDEGARVAGRADLAILGLTGVAAILMVLLRNSAEIIVFASFATFFTLLGLSLRTFGRILRRVA